MFVHVILVVTGRAARLRIFEITALVALLTRQRSMRAE